MTDIPQYQAHYNINGSGVGAVTFGSDDNLWVRFFNKPLIDQVESVRQGRPIHKNCDYVSIRQPAEKDEYVQPARPEDIMRFPRQWALYKEGRDQFPEGTPMAVLFPSDPAVVENLAYLKIVTIEQLAALNDTQIQNVGMGGRQWSDKAKKFLTASEKGKGFHELEAENDKMKLQLKAMQDKIEAITGTKEPSGIVETTKRKPGRPRKVPQVQEN